MANNYSVSIELSKFKSVICKMKNSQGEATEGIFIPFAANRLEKTDKNQVFVNAIAWENKEIKFDNTHSIKQSLPKAILDGLTDEQKKAIPYIGNMKPFGTEVKTNAVVDDNVVFESDPLAANTDENNYENNNLPF